MLPHGLTCSDYCVTELHCIRQHYEVRDVDLNQLLSISCPHDLRLVIVQLEAVATHPCLDAHVLNTGCEA